MAAIEKDAAPCIAAFDGAIEVVPLIDPTDRSGGRFSICRNLMQLRDLLQEMKDPVEFSSGTSSSDDPEVMSMLLELRYRKRFLGEILRLCPLWKKTVQLLRSSHDKCIGIGQSVINFKFTAQHRAQTPRHLSRRASPHSGRIRLHDLPGQRLILLDRGRLSNPAVPKPPRRAGFGLRHPPDTTKNKQERNPAENPEYLRSATRRRNC